MTSAMAGFRSLSDASRNPSLQLLALFSILSIILRQGTVYMVAPGRPDLYPRMLGLSRKELTSLPVVSAKIYSDLPVPILEPITMAGELQCSDRLSQAPLLILKESMDLPPPPKPYRNEGWEIPRGKSGCYCHKTRKTGIGEGIQSRHTALPLLSAAPLLT